MTVTRYGATRSPPIPYTTLLDSTQTGADWIDREAKNEMMVVARFTDSSWRSPVMYALMDPLIILDSDGL